MIDNSKRDKILESSLGEFAEYGYDKASTDRISRRAEVSKGLIFHYFGSKENLYMTTMNKCIDDIFEEFDSIEFPDTDFISRLMKMMEVKYNFFIKHSQHYKLIVNGFYDSPKKLQEKLKHRYSELKQIGYAIFVDMIKEMPIKKDISIDEIVSIIASITNVIESKYIYLFTDGTVSFEKSYDIVKEEYLRLINIIMYGILE
ncbi:TetR/AcrR family transcriptional regulator [Sedimentibacter sp.]|uniref:TetR/AcrR family transcriptional regulator n=1 Tax=Sedimentibacter sp. TaxID=1960295 RepID=UPI0028ADF986|nr:TetR/AcrR family transcriptional regulator [Sedimentibacter sp.]